MYFSSDNYQNNRLRQYGLRLCSEKTSSYHDTTFPNSSGSSAVYAASVPRRYVICTLLLVLRVFQRLFDIFSQRKRQEQRLESHSAKQMRCITDVAILVIFFVIRETELLAKHV